MSYSDVQKGNHVADRPGAQDEREMFEKYAQGKFPLAHFGCASGYRYQYEETRNAYEIFKAGRASVVQPSPVSEPMVSAYESCPICGSKDPAVKERLIDLRRHIQFGCPDTWHDASQPADTGKERK